MPSTPAMTTGMMFFMTICKGRIIRIRFPDVQGKPPQALCTCVCRNGVGVKVGTIGRTVDWAMLAMVRPTVVWLVGGNGSASLEERIGI